MGERVVGTPQVSNWIVGASWGRRLAALVASAAAAALLCARLIRRDGLPLTAFATRRAAVTIAAGVITLLACITVAELIARHARGRAGHERPAV